MVFNKYSRENKPIKKTQIDGLPTERLREENVI